MSGEQNLIKLLGSMSPRLIDGDYVFLSIAGAKYGDHCELTPFASVREPEGLTMIVEQALANSHGFDYEGVYKGITLEVHSSLEAVGLTAAFASALGDAAISANVIAGFYHDHIFVQQQYATKALEVLKALSSNYRK